MNDYFSSNTSHLNLLQLQTVELSCTTCVTAPLLSSLVKKKYT